MSRKSLDLALICGLALAGLALALLDAHVPALRALLGLPLVLFLPGYALSAALFPHPTLGGTERALFALSLSLTATILSGFVLNRSPWGLATEAWAVMLAYVTLGASMVALARRHLLPASAGVRLAPAPPVWRSLWLGAGQALMFALALAIVGGAIVLARDEAARQPAPDVIQLWMLPGDAADPNSVRVGIDSIGASGRFRLQIARDGYVIREWPELTIASGQRWQQTLALGTRQPGSGAYEARLYRAEEPGVMFRHVSLWPQAQP